MKNNSQMNNTPQDSHGEEQPSDDQESKVTEASMVEVLSDAYHKISKIHPGDFQEKAVRDAALWAISTLQRSAIIAQKPGLPSAIQSMEKGFNNIGKLAWMD